MSIFTSSGGITIGGIKFLGGSFVLTSDADGDMYYRTGGVLVRLPKGTSLQHLRMNVGATIPEWCSPDLYKDMWIPASAFTTRTTNGAVSGTVEYTSYYISRDYYDFDASVSQGIQVPIKFPSKWDASVAIKVKHVWTNGETGGSGNVVWTTRARAITSGDAIDGDWGTAVDVTMAALTDGQEMMTEASGAISIGNTPAVGDTVIVEVSRNMTGNVYAKKARYLGLWLQYKKIVSDNTASW